MTNVLRDAARARLQVPLFVSQMHATRLVESNRAPEPSGTQPWQPFSPAKW